ncbi:MAG: type III secretion inner membrane ring lipoprotein SctJ [Pseudomonadota bacterium]
MNIHAHDIWSRTGSIRRFCKVMILILLTSLLVACKTPVYQGLSEDQANEMLSTLLRRGISVEKIAEGKTGFTISVEESQLVQALEILKNNNLPRASYNTLGGIFAGDGMIASPSEESARLSFALSEELANTFSSIDGVLTSRVHVVLASTDLASDIHTPASVGVFLRHTPDSPVVNLIPKIREIAAKAVPGLDYERVSVMLVPVRESFTVPMAKTPEFLGLPFIPENGPPYFIIGSVLIIVAATMALVLIALSRFQEVRARRKEEAESSEES